MDHEQLLRCLYVSEAGEVQAFPQYEVQEARLDQAQELFQSIQPQPPDPNSVWHTVSWTPLRHCSKSLQQVILRLYQEREAAREYAVAFYWSARWQRTLAGFEKQRRLFDSIRQEPWLRDHQPVEEAADGG